MIPILVWPKVITLSSFECFYRNLVISYSEHIFEQNFFYSKLTTVMFILNLAVKRTLD